MSEFVEMRRIMIAISQAGATIFRNNVAMAWVGTPDVVRVRKTVSVGPGDVVLRNARPLHAGLCKGSSDLIGWRSVVVTPEMVGKRVAVFLAPEVKTQGGRVSPEQKNFHERVSADGGISGIVLTPADAIALMAAWCGADQ